MAIVANLQVDCSWGMVCKKILEVLILYGVLISLETSFQVADDSYPGSYTEGYSGSYSKEDFICFL